MYEHYQRELTTLRAKLATAKREGFANGAVWGAKNYLFSATHQAVLANEQAFREYPAIDPDSGSTCKPDCCLPNYCAPGEGCHATPSPEAREVPSEVVVDVETKSGMGWYSNGQTIVRITPADAKRIVELAQRSI
jgi:hypothetical protein